VLRCSVVTATGARRWPTSPARRACRPGNLYNYVDSKDALFYLVLRRMFGERPGDRSVELPVTGTSVAVTAEWVAGRLDFVDDFPQLERALTRRRPPNQRIEVEAVVGELFDVLARVRLGVEMIERSVDDLPELGTVFGDLRGALFARYERYLRARHNSARLRVAEPEAVAHLIVELCWWAAGRRHHDPHSAGISDATARRAVCALIVDALTSERSVASAGSTAKEKR
jgi:AcrR family transcriptional regulator